MVLRQRVALTVGRKEHSGLQGSCVDYSSRQTDVSYLSHHHCLSRNRPLLLPVHICSLPTQAEVTQQGGHLGL